MGNVKKVIAQHHHRNGVGGAGVVMSLFTVREQEGTFVAMSIFPDRPQNPVHVRDGESTRDAYIRHWLDDFATHTAVLNVEQTVAGNIAFAQGNSWRGADHYGPELAQAYRKAQAPYDPATERYDDEFEPNDEADIRYLDNLIREDV